MQDISKTNISHISKENKLYLSRSLGFVFFMVRPVRVCYLNVILMLNFNVISV